MDIIMPEMGGYEATQQIRKLEKDFNVSQTERHFICGFSAQFNQEIEKKCKDSGMDTVMAKPVIPALLKQMLDENKRVTNLVNNENMGS
jgi:CheY-like chemotaxis protein